MEKSSFYDELTVRNQFDWVCKITMQSELIDYIRHITYRQKHEKLFCELTKDDLNQLFSVDDYDLENHCFQVHGYDIEVKDTLIAEALETLTEKKRDVILLSYFMQMSDAEIAREMNLVRSTIQEHRKRSLELLRKVMEEKSDEKEKTKEK